MSTISSPLKICLISEEKKCLLELKSNPKVPKRTRQRAEVLVLSDQGRKVSAIAVYLNCAAQTVRQTFYRWLTQGRERLFDSPRSGRRPVWIIEDILINMRIKYAIAILFYLCIKILLFLGNSGATPRRR